MKEQNPRQMSIFTNNKAVIELINKLRPATPGKGSHLHRTAETDQNGRKMTKSMVGINIVDYEAEPSVFVEENLSPSQLKELYHEAIMKRNNYTFSGNGQKIFGTPDSDGYSTVRTIQIHRQGSFQQGGKTVIKRYPWKITIQNGKGKMIKQEKTGGYACQEGTFKCEKTASINLSDGDFFALFDQAMTYLTAWETCMAYHFVKANEEAICVAEEEWRKNANR